MLKSKILQNPQMFILCGKMVWQPNPTWTWMGLFIVFIALSVNIYTFCCKIIVWLSCSPPKKNLAYYVIYSLHVVLFLWKKNQNLKPKWPKEFRKGPVNLHKLTWPILAKETHWWLCVSQEVMMYFGLAYSGVACLESQSSSYWRMAEVSATLQSPPKHGFSQSSRAADSDGVLEILVASVVKLGRVPSFVSTKPSGKHQF